MQKIIPFLWFDGKAEDAMTFYVSIFKNSKVVSTMSGPDGKVLTWTFQLEGQQFMARIAGTASAKRLTTTYVFSGSNERTPSTSHTIRGFPPLF
jgi:predicted 3-demethylubiquinone-9 3-methyltransferase (glyoxalase superfamily)